MNTDLPIPVTLALRRVIRTLLLLTFACTCGRAQNTVSVYLTDGNNGQPIAGAFFALDTLQFGVSDERGHFRLQPPRTAAQLTVSHVAYQDTTVFLPVGAAPKLNVALRPATVELPAVSLSARGVRKFKSPARLVKMALKKVPENYRTEAAARTGLYREIVTYEGCPTTWNEGLLEYDLGGYGEKHRIKRAWAESWDRNYASYPHQLRGKTRLLAFDHPEGTQTYSGTQDAFRPLRTRISAAAPPHDFYSPFKDGPLEAVSLDKVRLGYDYLDAGSLKDYVYTLADSAIVNGAYCYHVTFAPADNTATRYFNLKKTQTTGVFSGSLYIALSDLAIVRFTATNDKAIRRNWSTPSPAGRYAPARSIRTTVDYAPAANGRWELKSVTSRVESPIDARYVANRSLHLAEVRTGLPSAGGGRWYRQDFRTNLLTLTRRYDAAFWNAFERSALYRTGRLQRFDCPDGGRPADAAFLAPFTADTVRVPRARPQGNLEYVKESRVRNAWDWLEEREDSATTNYLRWENDYYDQYFRHRPETMEEVAAQFSREAQGRPVYQARETAVDTVLRSFDGKMGFYRIVGEDDTTLLAPAAPPPVGYVLTDYGWNRTADYFYSIVENRAYDRQLTVTDRRGKLAEISGVDDHRRRGDTLYLTVNNEKLRTAGFLRWTPAGGTEKVLEEADPTFEFRMVTTPDGELLLLRESLTTAMVYRQAEGEWRREPGTVSAMLGGTGPRGRGCGEPPAGADYVADCRTTPGGTCVIAVRDARHELRVLPRGETKWRKVALPAGHHSASFRDGKAGNIIIETEGVGTYGRRYAVEVASATLREQPTPYPPVELTGYRDSIILVTARDGTQIPCQLRWRPDRADSLRATLLTVYAAYGNSYLIGHSEEDIALMNLGFAVVYVHARGGGARGPAWYDAGRERNKLVACKDYVAALRHFRDRHPLGRRMPLAGFARSAGGPVLGYAVNNHPELLSAAVFDHAFLDVATIMARPELPLTEYEYPEWGDPSERRVREVQAAYSPFQNIREQAYPPMLFQAGFHDRSTPYWQVARFVAALRAANGGAATTIFTTAWKGSHPGTPFGPGNARRMEWIGFLVEELRRH